MSYAQGRGDRLKHWSQCLARELENDILDLQVEFDDLDIFIDTELDPTKRLTGQLRGKVRSSGLLLVIMSNRYLRSAWCKDELEWFDGEIRQCQSEGGLVLVVRAQPTAHAAWPDCLKDERGHVVLGFQFHPDSKGGDEVVHPYGWPEPQPSDRAYFEELGKLATSVTRRLREIRDRNELKAQASQPRVRITIEGEPQIYLQAPAGELDVWQSTKKALEEAGCKVLPDRLLQIGDDLKAMQDARKERLQILQNQAHALCLLHCQQGNGVVREIEAIANDRLVMQAFGKDVPCAVLNLAGGDLPLAKALGIDTIPAVGDEWLLHFQGWLQCALNAPSTP